MLGLQKCTEEKKIAGIQIIYNMNDYITEWLEMSLKPHRFESGSFEKYRNSHLLLLLFTVALSNSALTYLIMSIPFGPELLLGAGFAVVSAISGGAMYAWMLSLVSHQFGEKKRFSGYLKAFLLISSSVIVFQMLLVPISPLAPPYVVLIIVFLYVNYALIGITMSVYGLGVFKAILYNGIVPAVLLMVFAVYYVCASFLYRS